MAWVDAALIERRDWSEGLSTFRFDAELEAFEPGQWLRLALTIDGERVRRAYSLASAPGELPELYLNLVPGGHFTPHLFQRKPGDAIELDTKPQGFFTLQWLPAAEHLWMIATGTGLAPYISWLRSEATWQRFRRIVVVHGVRRAQDLAYRDELLERASAHDGRLVWLPVVSREPDASGVIHGRVTGALAAGELERAASLALSPAHSHVLLCGNPDMIHDMSAALAERGLARHRQRKPGHVTSESYW
jgi:ferredoxin/flavodoxin---NADP+ reductase